MALAPPSDQLAGSAVSSFGARLRQNLRFDGLWWRKLAALGCGYGPQWVKRYLPAPTAAVIFLLVRLNRRGAIANMARVVGTTRRTEAALAALRMYAEFARCMTEGRYLYCARDLERRAVQRRHRMEGIDVPGAARPRREVRIGDEAKAALLLFLATLNERQRRLYAGLESLRLGYGGDRRIAELTGLDVHTVARGRQELLATDFEAHGVRREGAGRVPVEEKRPR